MDIEKDIQPISDFRANTSKTLARIRRTGRPVILTQRGRSAAVVLDVATYQSLVDELETLRDIHAALADVAEGRVTSHDDSREQLLSRYR